MNSRSAPHCLHVPLLDGPAGVSIIHWWLQATASSAATSWFCIDVDASISFLQLPSAFTLMAFASQFVMRRTLVLLI